MSAFQVLGLCVVALLLVAAFRRVLRERPVRLPSFAWLLLWCAAGVALAWPDVTVRLARLLGIGRGADLLIYCAVLAMLAGFSHVYLKLRRMDRQITLLVRTLALKEAAGPGAGDEAV